ncbi:MAG: hypothetical protein M9932_09975 [Xanthobacteraceae bacterium]|nr:hypothetical protein [Xanthobacteraceae bacterium]
MHHAGAEELDRRRSIGHIPAWFWVGSGVLLLVLLRGHALLNDPDTFWQIRMGQWIVAHGAVPHADLYSFTRAGEPWISSSWLAQVAFAKAYAAGGWGGIVVLTALAIAATFALLVRALERYWPPVYASLAAIMAIALAAQHLSARPHVLALPIMVTWIAALIAASERRETPSFRLLPLMVLWANLHGGFILGLALIAPILFDAVWNADASQRFRLAVRWIVFGLAALLAACVTPYGWGTLLAAKSIVDLGPLLPLISEWAPPDFSQFSIFEAVVLLVIGAALWRGVTLPLPRIVLVLGFLHMALGHVRSIEVLALLTPLALAAPLARQFGQNAGDGPVATQRNSPALRWAVPLVALMVAAVVSSMQFRPNVKTMPTAAVAALKQHQAARVFNDYDLGGYLIWAGVAPFVDGRTELYGRQFVSEVFAAQSLRRPDLLLALLDRYRIDATLLVPTSPAALLMDHLDGWRRIYADDIAVAHVRTAAAADGAAVVKPEQPR